jgi:hypothetical protein
MARVVVGRLDNNKPVDVSDDATIGDALSAGGYVKSDNEVIQDVEGNEYNANDCVESNLSYFLVQRVKSGC